MSNTDLWDSICVTDPSAVKAITGKPYQGNSPKPYWLIRKATEKFGPCGDGWGINVKSESFFRMTDTDVMHSCVVQFWYVLPGVEGGPRNRCVIEQMGQTKACYQTSSGKMMVDEDAGKKSVTDGMVKCMSMIGFAGDIFSGRWDDSSYVEWAAQQYDPMTQVLNDFAAKLVQLHEEKNTMEAVKEWYESDLVKSSNEAREYLWSQLHDYSSLRSAIKANKPE
jgi:hypothetical protein